jgi:UDP-2,3-diacylglucosamine pyrophosphatase LpxH
MPSTELRDVVVVSDLHIGRGKNNETGRYYELETFFYDEDFRRFCEFSCREAAERGTELELVLNGDTFDLLRLDPLPLPEEFARRPSAFGPVLTPARAAIEVTRLLEGHPVFLQALAGVLAGGHHVLFLPGNHDIEVQWPPVQEAIRTALLECDVFADRSAAERALTRLRFLPWFYHQPGRFWIEHGCQYDPENAFRYPLRGGLVDASDALHEAELDNPLGNFFQKYLYNAFGHITFIVPSTRANTRYLKWLVFNEPRLLLRVIGSHWRFWWQVLRRVAKYPSRQRDRLEKAHTAELAELAESSGLGPRLFAIDRLKETRADVTTAVQSIARQTIKLGLGLLLVLSLVMGLWFAAIHGLTQLEMGLVGKASVFLGFGLMFLFSAFGAVLYLLTRANTSVPPQPLREAGAEIARLLDVPIVVFGHTHDEVLWRQQRPSGDPSWYYNTGTWIAVFTHDVLLPRERLQFTFLRIRGRAAELLHWSPGRREPLPVILLDEPIRPGRAFGTSTAGASMAAGVIASPHDRAADV